MTGMETKRATGKCAGLSALLNFLVTKLTAPMLIGDVLDFVGKRSCVQGHL